MNTIEVEALALIAEAPIEATRKALAVYPAQPLPDKTGIMVRGRGLVFTKFGNAGINTLIFSAANAARAASKRAELRDHWDWRVIEIATENLAIAQMVKSWLKPSDFEMLMKPWATYLGEPWTSIEGCATEVAPESVVIHTESVTERKARERKEATAARHAAKDAASAARAVARNEKKKQPIRQRVQHEMASKAAQEPSKTIEKPAHKPAPVEIDLVAAIAGGGTFTAPVKEPVSVNVASLAKPKPFLADGLVRLMWWKRDECWKIIMPAPSKATAVATHFDTQELAQSYADEQGWTVVGVVTPKG